MKKSIGLAFVSAVLAVSGVADAEERDVTIATPNGDMVGTLTVPEGAAAPVVLMLHGFTGSRDELKTDSVSEGVFARTAAKLEAAGYASLRIDFRGSGESLSDITYADTTFEGQVADALAAFDYLAANDAVDGDDIYLLGWSQGGLVATAAAGRTDRPDAVALWAAVANPVETYTGILGAEVMAAGAAADADEGIDMTLPWGAELTLNGAFFDGIASYDPAAEIAGYDGPLFVAQGALDTTVLPGSADILLAAHEGEEQAWRADMDHVFNTFATAETLDALIGETVSFFDAHRD